jgi:hypothetical protein
MAFKKKLYQCHPSRPQPPLPAHRTRSRVRMEPADSASIERQVRQLLADKVWGNLVGLWLLMPEQTVAQATPGLLDLAGQILSPHHGSCLVLADTEHYKAELVDHVCERTPLDLLVPMPQNARVRACVRALPPDAFTPRWAGFATAKVRGTLPSACSGPHWQFIQRCGEAAHAYEYKAFLCTRDAAEADELCLDFPQRWHVEEFFNAHQALGWNRASTLNLHIRCGHMTLALLAQAALYQLRQRLGEPYANWDCEHLAKAVLRGMDGDVRVYGDTIVVTLYNAPDVPPPYGGLRAHFEHLPAKLRQEGVDPRVPWLYDFQLDLRFR